MFGPAKGIYETNKVFVYLVAFFILLYFASNTAIPWLTNVNDAIRGEPSKAEIKKDHDQAVKDRDVVIDANKTFVEEDQRKKEAVVEVDKVMEKVDQKVADTAKRLDEKKKQFVTPRSPPVEKDGEIIEPEGPTLTAGAYIWASYCTIEACT